MLEDDAGDILRKARMGQSLALGEVAGQAGLAKSALSEIEGLEREPTPAECHSLASVLGLDAEKLGAIAERRYQPRVPSEEFGGARVRSLLVSQPSGWTSNCYLMAFEEPPVAMVVDPGAEPGRIKAALDKLGWRLGLVLLTHGHEDHVNGVRDLVAGTEVPVWAGVGDRAMVPLPTERVAWIDRPTELEFAGRMLRALPTPGHTAGGVCFALAGRCFVGDTLFAGSLGKANVPHTGYAQLRGGVRDNVLSLPPETVLYPGHGPLTTVGEERRANPFF